MKKCCNILLVLLVLLGIYGCTKAVRYTPEEIGGYPPEIQEHIKKNTIVMGMTTQQVRYSWGAPSMVNVLSPSADGKPREEWIYSRFGIFRTRLIFTDGRLTEMVSTEPGIAK